MNSFPIKIVTPDGELYSGEATSLTVKTDEGEVQILAKHADYLATLGTGRAKIAFPDGTERTASSQGGFLSVTGGEVSLVAVTFEFKEDIDLKRALLAKENAEKTLSSASDEHSVKLAKAKLIRALSRISVASEK